MKDEKDPGLKEAQDELFSALFGKQKAIRLLYEKDYGPSPHIGWAPMLCQIIRDASKLKK